jgi:hypothetical protein
MIKFTLGLFNVKFNYMAVAFLAVFIVIVVLLIFRLIKITFFLHCCHTLLVAKLCPFI